MAHRKRTQSAAQPKSMYDYKPWETIPFSSSLPNLSQLRAKLEPHVNSYTWEDIKVPLSCPRAGAVLELVRLYQEGILDDMYTLYSAIDLMDKFVKNKLPRRMVCMHIGYKCSIMRKAAPHVYSTILAHTCAVIAAKYSGAKYTLQEACFAVGTIYPRKLEWEVLASVDYKFSQCNFGSWLAGLFGGEFRPGPVLEYLLKEVALKLSHCDPRAVWLGIILLWRRNRLKAVQQGPRTRALRWILIEWGYCLEELQQVSMQPLSAA